MIDKYKPVYQYDENEIIIEIKRLQSILKRIRKKKKEQNNRQAALKRR